MSFDIAGGLRNLLPGPLDSLRGPYDSLAAANGVVPSTSVNGKNFREGKFVEIGTNGVYKTYWWKGTGQYLDSDLVEYIQEVDVSDFPTKEEVYSKSQVYRKDQVYSKSETLPASDLYARQQLYTKSQIDQAIIGLSPDSETLIPIFESKVSTEDLTTKVSSFTNNPVSKFLRVSSNMISNLVSDFTGEPFTANRATTKPGGSPVTINDVNNIDYFVDTDGVFYKRNYLFGQIDAREYGVIGDGITNNVERLQYALDSCFKNNIVLIVPPGDYIYEGIDFSSSYYKIRGVDSTRCRLINISEVNDGVKLPYVGDPRSEEWELSGLTLSSYSGRNANQSGLFVDTTKNGILRDVYIENYMHGISERAMWKTDIQNITITGCFTGWVIGGEGLSTPGVPNERRNTYIYDCDRGIDIYKNGINAASWTGGCVESYKDFAVRIVGNTNRTIAFRNFNFESDNAQFDKYDIILGDLSDATSGPSNITFDTIQFTKRAGANQKIAAFQLNRGSALEIRNSHFGGYAKVAEISTSFGSIFATEIKGISTFCTTNNANTNIPVPNGGFLSGTRNSFVLSDTTGFHVFQESNNNKLITSRRYSELYPRFTVGPFGELNYHPFNTATPDTILKREALGELSINGQLILNKLRVAGPASLSLTNETVVILPQITQNQSLTLLSASDFKGKIVSIQNKNTSSFTWGVSGCITPDGKPFPVIPNKSTVSLMPDGVNWVLISIKTNDFITATDADHVLNYAGVSVLLPGITADRTELIPDPDNCLGEKITFHNRNSSTFKWALNYSYVDPRTGLSSNIVPNQSVTIIESYGSTYRLVNVYGGSSAAIADIDTPNATDSATAITLANANKSKINQILSAMRQGGIISV